MSLDEATVADAVDSLHARGLVGRREGARVVKYEHLVRMRHSLPPAEQAVLALLMLRGPQTPGELKTNVHRLFEFDDLDDVRNNFV